MDSAVIDLSAAYAVAIQSLNYDYIDRGNVVAPAWASTRAELWDTLDYFRTLRSNTYINGGSVLGFLVPDDPGELGYLDSELLITTIGPQTDDQGTPNLYTKYLVDAWRKTLENDGSVVVLMDTRCPLLRVAVHLHQAVQYVVLENFRVRHIWAEMSSPGHAVWKIALQKYELFEESWWTPQQPEIPRDRDFSDNWTLTPGILDSEVCTYCGQSSPRIYDQAWACLDIHCYKLGELDPSLGPPSYSIEFLRKRRSAIDEHVPSYHLVPNRWFMLEGMSRNNFLHLKLRDLYRGIVCETCSKCLHRTSWSDWRCTHCDKVHQLPPSQIPLPAVLTRRTEPSFRGPPPFVATWPSDIQHRGPLFRPANRVDRFLLAHGAQLTIISPMESFNELAHGPDALFDGIASLAREGKLGLRRYPLANNNNGLGGCSNFFAAEWGDAKYAFHDFPLTNVTNAGTIIKPANAADSLPIEEAVMRAGSLLDGVEQAEVSGRAVGVNSIQLLAYMEGMELPWHTDSEGEVGNVVSTLSLGGDATFLVRLRAEYRSFSDPLLDPSNPAAHVAANGTPIVLPLIHGSIVIMEGLAFSHFYEYKIETHDRLRFEITNRTIDLAERNRLPPASAQNRPSGHLFLRDTLFTTGVEEIKDNVSELDGQARYDWLNSMVSGHMAQQGRDRARSMSPPRRPSDRRAEQYQQRDRLRVRDGNGDMEMADLLREAINADDEPAPARRSARRTQPDAEMEHLGVAAYQPAVRPDEPPAAPQPQVGARPSGRRGRPPNRLVPNTRAGSNAGNANTRGGSNAGGSNTGGGIFPANGPAQQLRSRVVEWTEATTNTLVTLHEAGWLYRDIVTALREQHNFEVTGEKCRNRIYRLRKNEAAAAARAAASAAGNTVTKLANMRPGERGAGVLEVNGRRVIWAWKAPEGDTYPPWIIGHGGKGGSAAPKFAGFGSTAKKGWQGAPLLPSTGKGVLRGPPTAPSLFVDDSSGPRTGVPMLPDTPGVLSPFGGQTHLGKASDAHRSPARVAFDQTIDPDADEDVDLAEASHGARMKGKSPRKAKSPSKSQQAAAAAAKARRNDLRNQRVTSGKGSFKDLVRTEGAKSGLPFSFAESMALVKESLQRADLEETARRMKKDPEGTREALRPMMEMMAAAKAEREARGRARDGAVEQGMGQIPVLDQDQGGRTVGAGKGRGRGVSAEVAGAASKSPAKSASKAAGKRKKAVDEEVEDSGTEVGRGSSRASREPSTTPARELRKSKRIEKK